MSYGKDRNGIYGADQPPPPERPWWLKYEEARAKDLYANPKDKQATQESIDRLIQSGRI